MCVDLTMFNNLPHISKEIQTSLNASKLQDKNTYSSNNVMCKAMPMVLKPVSCCNGWRTTLANHLILTFGKVTVKVKVTVGKYSTNYIQLFMTYYWLLTFVYMFYKSTFSGCQGSWFLPWQLFDLLKGHHKGEGQSTTVAKGSSYLKTWTKDVYFYNYWGLPCHVKSKF